MNNYSQYKAWQEQDGKLVPVSVRPDLDDVNYHSEKEYDKAWEAYNESLKISLPVIGDINTIKGRKDLKIEKDFYLKREKDEKSVEYGLRPIYKTVAVLIDNKQKDVVDNIQIMAEEKFETLIPKTFLKPDTQIKQEASEKFNQENTKFQNQDVPNTDADKQKEEVNKFYELSKEKIDFSDHKQMAEDCWLFLTNDELPEKATIKKEAFLHEVKVMIETAAQHAAQPKELPKQLEEVKEDAIAWKDEDIAEAWNSAYGGDSFLDGKDYLQYMKENYKYLKS